MTRCWYSKNQAHNAFQDITDFVRSLKLQIDYGYYSDDWMDEHASLTVMAGSTGEIELEFMYPGVMSGGRAIYITKDKRTGPYTASSLQRSKYHASGRAVAVSPSGI